MAVKGRLGILGGAFDPPHIGHVALARAALDELDLERLLVLVVAEPGHKETKAPADARLELTRLAFEDVPGVDVELDSHARTVDSLEARKPRDAVFIIGGDEFADFWQWKRPERVLELARLGVAMRPGVPDDRVREAHARLPAPDRISYFSLEPVPVSSSLVRQRIARGGRSTSSFPTKVAEAIRASRSVRARRVDWNRGKKGAHRLNPLEQARRTAALCQEKLATDVTILDMRGVCDFTDFFVIATGRNPRQTKAIYDEVAGTLKKEQKLIPRASAGLPEASWIVGDYNDFVLHIFTPETRGFYRLEDLWSDVPSVEVEALAG